MHHVVALIAERQKGICTNRSECYVPYVQSLMQNYYRAGGLTGSSLSILMGRGKVVYILRFSDPTFALLLV
ncbi:hypothetical protein Hanom_Chr12g01097251 [Helianthus anomalus]